VTDTAIFNRRMFRH